MANLDRILLRQDSWSRDIIQWGDLDSTVVEAVLDQGHLEDLLIRIDMRGGWRDSLLSLWRVCEESRCRLIMLDGEPLHTIEEAVLHASISPAARFVDDPDSFLTDGG